MNNRGFAGGNAAIGAVLMAGGALAGLPAAAAASPARQALIEQCREKTSDEARIACLEEALASAGAGTEAAAEESPAPAPEAQPAPGDQPAPEPPPEPAAPPAARGAAERTAGESGASRIGAEQVRARSETAAEREARLLSASGLRVAGYSEVPFRRLRVELENGQVWQQIKGDTQHVPVDLERNQTVDIEESTLGGYKLRLNEIRRTIRVERIR